MANKRPEIQDRIILASFLAPVAFADNMKSPLRMFAPYAYSLQVTGQDELTLPNSYFNSAKAGEVTAT